MTTDIPNENLRNRISVAGLPFLHPHWAKCIIAMIWGATTATAFPPFDFSVIIWLTLLPLAFVNPAKKWNRAFRLGFFFGFGHFFVNLFWLRTIHILIVFPLAGYCALYNGIWLTLYSRMQKYLSSTILRVFSATSCWIMLDLVRGHLLTGFPWNFPGIALWQNPDPGIIRIAGIYGETFLIIFTSLAITETIGAFCNGEFKANRLKSILPLGVATTLFLLTFWLNSTVVYDQPSGHLKVMPVQGNIPLCRDYTQEQFYTARDTYLSLTEEGVKKERPDLVVWPETAVPAPLRQVHYYYAPFQAKMKELKLPTLVGSIDFRKDPQKPFDKNSLSFNSAMYFDADGHLKKLYDKTHPVPFGEFVPLGEQFPALVSLIGMGRGLTAGTQYTVFDQLAPAYFGVNICYEDVFPGISRKFILNGANMLMTITNDAWYHESAGSRQHFAHSIFRAIENNVHFLRSGNRSYTSLTAPNGKTLQCYKDEKGNVFTATAGLFKVPFTYKRSLTFYTKYGDLFAIFCTFIAICAFFRITYSWFHTRKKLYQDIVGEEHV